MPSLPESSWDSHCHVFDPDNHPFIPDTPYTPPAHSVEELIRDSPCDNHVIVMAVPDGTDCGSMLDGIQRHRSIKGDARGVAVLSTEQLSHAANCRRLYNAGVRSVRIHESRIRLMLKKEDLDMDDLIIFFTETARRIHEIKVDWSIEAQLDVAIWSGLLPTLRQLHDRYGTIFVVDHTFNMTPEKIDSPDFEAVLNALSEGMIWVKLSGMSRFASDYREMRPILQAIIRARPDRVVFGSDAPHVLTQGKAGRFAEVDVSGHLEMLHEICVDQEGSWEMLMRRNAEALYK